MFPEMSEGLFHRSTILYPYMTSSPPHNEWAIPEISDDAGPKILLGSSTSGAEWTIPSGCCSFSPQGFCAIGRFVRSLPSLTKEGGRLHASLRPCGLS